MPPAVVGNESNRLFNEPIGTGPSGGTVELLSNQIAGAKQIADAQYDPQPMRLLVSFRGSTATEVIL